MEGEGKTHYHVEQDSQAIQSSRSRTLWPGRQPGQLGFRSTAAFSLFRLCCRFERAAPAALCDILLLVA